jgi:charged multivesicular body protein 7
MLKRKSSAELGGRPHAGATQLPSIYGARPRRRRKLFRSKTRDNPRWQPQPEPAMPELLDFILQHEDAFQKSAYPKPPRRTS